MNLQQAHTIAIEAMTKHGLIQQGWIFQFDNAVRRFGVCKGRRKIISLSKPLTELNSEEQVTDTILHEIAHALVGIGNGHNDKWKAKCLEVGCNPERCYDSSTTNNVEGKYIATCLSCKTIYHTHKKPKHRSSCKCNGTGRFTDDERWLLVYLPNQKVKQNMLSV